MAGRVQKMSGAAPDGHAYSPEGWADESCELGGRHPTRSGAAPERKWTRRAGSRDLSIVQVADLNDDGKNCSGDRDLWRTDRRRDGAVCT